MTIFLCQVTQRWEILSYNVWHYCKALGFLLFKYRAGILD